MPASSFTAYECLPVHDCEGQIIKVGDFVYLSAGWTGTKPNPWIRVHVVGIAQPLGKRPWLNIEGYDMRTVPAYTTCKRQPVNEDGTLARLNMANPA